MRDDPVHEALLALARRLDADCIPYAVAGGMALVAHGYDRTTADVDVLVTADGLGAIGRRLVAWASAIDPRSREATSSSVTPTAACGWSSW